MPGINRPIQENEHFIIQNKVVSKIAAIRG